MVQTARVAQTVLAAQMGLVLVVRMVARVVRAAVVAVVAVEDRLQADP